MGMTARGRKRLLALVLVAAALGAAALGAVALREHRRAGMVEAALQDGLAAYAASDYTRTMNRLGFFVSRSNGDDDTLLADVFYKMADARRRVPMENRRHVLLAAELARRAAELTPTDPAPREMLLDLYTQMGFVSESLDNAAALLALRPGHAEAMWVRIRSLSALGRRTEAIQVAEEMAEAHPQDIRPRQAAIELLVAIGRPIGEILEYAAEQAQARPDDVLARLLLARVQAISGDNVAAAATLLDAREMPITNPDALGEMVRLLDAVGAPAEADRLLARYRGSDELGPAAALIEVERRWKLGDLASARAAADVLIASAPTPSDAALGWAALSTSSEQGAAYLDALRERKSAEAQFWLGLAQARDLVLARNWTQAGAQLGLLETQAPTAHRDLVAYWLGVTQGALGEQTRAVQYLLDASRLDPNWEFARAQLVMQLLRLGRVEEAVMRARAMENPRTLEGALATAHAVTAAVERGGLGLFSVNEGVTALTELTKRDPTNGDFSSMLIRAYAAVAGWTTPAPSSSG
jgi:hypothetical protein